MNAYGKESMRPQTFLVGSTQPDTEGLSAYLHATGQQEFFNQFAEAVDEHGPICLCSFYAKLCYASLVLGKNANVSKVRDIEENIVSCFVSGHGSVFEHVNLNFVTTNCSRVFTHELVRHRVGTAFSQTSGRYVSIDEIRLVLPPELITDDTAHLIDKLRDDMTAGLRAMREALITPGMSFADKKRLTSAIRRLAPNGQTNEIGWSCNIRSLRHMIEMRTSPAAEWEIREVFIDVAKIVQKRWPLMLYGGEQKEDGSWVKLRV